MISRCDSCNGRKELLGLGGMVKKCTACKGIGYRSFDDIVDDAVKECEDKFAERAPKKRGRKPKEQ